MGNLNLDEFLHFLGVLLSMEVFEIQSIGMKKDVIYFQL